MGKRDAVYYTGLIIGMIIGTLVMQALGFTGLFRILGGLATGVALGYVAEKAFFANPQQPPQIEQSDTRLRTCPNPNCGWQTDDEYASHCPQCGETLPHI